MFGEWLKAARLEAKLTQEVLAERVGVEKSYIGLIENNHRRPSMDVLIALARAVGKSETEAFEAFADMPAILSKAVPGGTTKRREIIKEQAPLFDEEYGPLFYNLKQLKLSQRKKLRSVMEILDREVARLLAEQSNDPPH